MSFGELYQAMRLRFGDADASQSMGDWICNNTTLKGKAFSFNRYPFQQAISDDMHPNLVVKKCSQIGLTEVQLRKFLAILTRSSGVAGLFTFPNDDMQKRTYNGRLKPILEKDDIFNPPVATKPTRSKDQIQIRDSFGYISGCTESDATNTSADFLFHDEVDLSPQDMLGLYQSRLQGSDMKMTQQFSTPTFAKYGIDREYAKTDQREYMVKCGSCNEWQVPLFTPEFVYLKDWEKFDVEHFTDLTMEQILVMETDDSHVRCHKCQSRLDLSSPDLREWVATYPSRTNFRGYQVRPFSTDRIKPSYIFTQLANYQERSFTRGFYNTVLGQEYTSADARISRDTVLEAMQRGTASIPNISRETPCYMGIDVGLTCHITISYDDFDTGLTHYVLFDTVPAMQLVERVNDLFKIYNVVQGCIDRFPYTTEANAVRDATSMRIMPLQYRGMSYLAPNFEGDTKILSHYSGQNTLLLDAAKAKFDHKKITLSGYQGDKETLINQLTSMVRNEKPGEDEPAEWLKTDGNDHFFHSIALNQVARRVGDHIFATQTSSTGISSSFEGGKFGSGSGAALNFQGGGKLAGMNKIARLG